MCVGGGVRRIERDREKGEKRKRRGEREGKLVDGRGLGRDKKKGE